MTFLSSFGLLGNAGRLLMSFLALRNFLSSFSILKAHHLLVLLLMFKIACPLVIGLLKVLREVRR